MTTGRVQISEELDSRLLSTGAGFGNAHDGLAGAGAMPVDGIDPSSIAATDASIQQTKDLIERGKKTSEQGRSFVRDGEDEATKSARDVESVDDEVDKDFKDGKPGTATSADAAQQGPANANPLGGMAGQGMPQMGMPSYSPGALPTPPMASQFDMNNAPNRDALRSAARDGLADGSLPGSRAGHHAIDTGVGDTEAQQRLLAAVDAALNSQPPIPYAWGGGHGGAPGPSQGTSDGGGWADQNGDYNKMGVDCSGFYRWMAYAATGEDIANGTSQSLWSSGMPVSSPQVGDAAFPAGTRPPTHIQVYIGNGMVAEAQKSGTFLLTNEVSPGTEFRRFF